MAWRSPNGSRHCLLEVDSLFWNCRISWSCQRELDGGPQLGFGHFLRSVMIKLIHQASRMKIVSLHPRGRRRRFFHRIRSVWVATALAPAGTEPATMSPLFERVYDDEHLDFKVLHTML